MSAKFICSTFAIENQVRNGATRLETVFDMMYNTAKRDTYLIIPLEGEGIKG